MSEPIDMRMLERHVELLSEHFCTVQIFVTRHEMGTDGGTVGASKGSGNWYARCGQVTEWLMQKDECIRIGERSRDQ